MTWLQWESLRLAMKNVSKEVRKGPWDYCRTIEGVSSKATSLAFDEVLMKVLHGHFRGELFIWFANHNIRF